MDGFEGWVSLKGTTNPIDLQNSKGTTVFDASQYAFFGNDAVEEVELGGLEEEDDFQPVSFRDDDFQLEREEGEIEDSLSEIDDLASTFSKLNKVVNAPRAAGVVGWGSGESYSAVEWAQRPDFPNWFDHQVTNSDSSSAQDSKRWSSHPDPFDANYMDPKFLYRTSSYPEPQQQQQQYPHQHFFSEPILVPKTSLSSYPRFPSHPGGSHMPFSSPNLSPLSNHQFQLPALPKGLQFNGNLQHYNTLSHPANSLPQNQWAGQANMSPVDRSNSYNWLQQKIPRPNGLMNPQLMQHGPNHPFQQPYGNLSATQSPLLIHQFPPSPPMMNKFEAVLGYGDLRDQRSRSLPKTGQGYRYSQQNFDNCNGWPQFRSKYMSSNEIENILRIQLAATHSNDPYVDDYYHQACLAKKSSGAKLRHHFCPHHLRDLPPHARANSEPHAYLRVDALGRVAFPSIRRPRPLIEVDPLNSSVSAEHNLSEKPSEKEPLLAARVSIEDGLYLLLDVDDIDRFLQFNPLQDGGDHLRRRRQVLLDELAASLQLIDPLGKNGHSVDLSLKDDLVFLRVVSLPKGRKLLAKYFQLLVPNSEVARVVCMAIFRHLRFLFGNPSTDRRAAESTINLVENILSCIGNMELKALSSCLASVVCSSEHPPLRPIGSSAGDGASVLLKSVLERATELLTHPSEGGSCSGANRSFWPASFDSFFGLLTKFCFGKYDTILQSLLMQGLSIDMAVIKADAARAIRLSSFRLDCLWLIYAQHKLNEFVKDEIVANQRMILPGKSLTALNGALLNIEDIVLYQLVDMVHHELSLADQCSNLKMTMFITSTTWRKMLCTRDGGAALMIS